MFRILNCHSSEEIGCSSQTKHSIENKLTHIIYVIWTSILWNSCWVLLLIIRPASAGKFSSAGCSFRVNPHAQYSSFVTSIMRVLALNIWSLGSWKFYTSKVPVAGGWDFNQWWYKKISTWFGFAFAWFACTETSSFNNGAFVGISISVAQIVVRCCSNIETLATSTRKLLNKDQPLILYCMKFSRQEVFVTF